MLPKAHRASKFDFDGFNKPVKSLHSSNISVRLFVLKANTNKFAVTISKKIDKKAVVRNRLRRNTYSQISKHIKDFPLGYVYHFIFNSKPVNIKEDIFTNVSEIINKLNK